MVLWCLNWIQWLVLHGWCKGLFSHSKGSWSRLLPALVGEVRWRVDAKGIKSEGFLENWRKWSGKTVAHRCTMFPSQAWAAKGLPIGCPRQAGDLPKIALCWDATVAIRKKHELARGHYVTLGNLLNKTFQKSWIEPSLLRKIVRKTWFQTLDQLDCQFWGFLFRWFCAFLARCHLGGWSTLPFRISKWAQG